MLNRQKYINNNLLINEFNDLDKDTKTLIYQYYLWVNGLYYQSRINSCVFDIYGIKTLYLNNSITALSSIEVQNVIVLKLFNLFLNVKINSQAYLLIQVFNRYGLLQSFDYDINKNTLKCVICNTCTSILFECVDMCVSCCVKGINGFGSSAMKYFTQDYENIKMDFDRFLLGTYYHMINYNHWLYPRYYILSGVKPTTPEFVTGRTETQQEIIEFLRNFGYFI